MEITTMSFSFMDTFMKCPLQHKFKYVDRKEKMAGDESNLRLGSLVHKALEIYRMRGGDAKLVMDDASKEMKFDVMPTMVKEATDMVTEWIQSADTSGSVIKTEWHFDKQIPGRNFNINGYIDLVEMLPDGAMRVTDYKTGYTVYTMEDLENSLQLMMYAIAVLDDWHPHGIEVCYDIVRMGRITRRVTRMDMILAMRRIDKIKNEIESCTTPKPRLGNHCGYCSYRHLCTEFQGLNQIEESVMTIQDGTMEQRIREYKRIYNLYKALEARKNTLKSSIEGYMTETQKPVIDLGDVRAKLRFPSATEYDPGTVAAMVPIEDLATVMSVEKAKMDKYLRSCSLSQGEKDIIFNHTRNLPRRSYVVVD